MFNFRPDSAVWVQDISEDIWTSAWYGRCWSRGLWRIQVHEGRACDGDHSGQDDSLCVCCWSTGKSTLCKLYVHHIQDRMIPSVSTAGPPESQPSVSYMYITFRRGVIPSVSAAGPPESQPSVSYMYISFRTGWFPVSTAGPPESQPSVSYMYISFRTGWFPVSTAGPPESQPSVSYMYMYITFRTGWFPLCLLLVHRKVNPL